MSPLVAGWSHGGALWLGIALGQPRERFPLLNGKGEKRRDKQHEGDVLCTSAREFVLVLTQCAFTRNAGLLSVTAPVLFV